MARIDSDRPLTDVQERALEALSQLDHEEPGVFHSMMEEVSSRARARATDSTAQALKKHGLVEVRYRPPFYFSEARITDEGRAMLASMGD